MNSEKESLIEAIEKTRKIIDALTGEIAVMTKTLIEKHADFKIGEKAKLTQTWPKLEAEVQVVSVRYTTGLGFIYEARKLTKKGAVNQHKRPFYINPKMLPKAELIKL